MPFLKQYRNSQTAIDGVYFWTATIKDWIKLLEEDTFKYIVIESLQYLVQTKKVTIFGYVIMPNHIHLLWRLDKMNGKESPRASLLKFTAHEFKKELKEDLALLNRFKVSRSDRDFQFWQPDALAIPAYSREVILQKLDYIHNNPLQERWRLALTPAAYPFSSARYYEDNIDPNNLTTHVNEIL